MWKTWTAVAILAAIFVFQMNSLTSAAPTLTVGDPAPEIKVGKWLKGDPVTKIEEGKVYIMEFWATWCGPCIANIPHLSALQKKYPDVVVIATDIWERDPAATEPFFKEMGEKMEYRVAVDDMSNPLVDPTTGTQHGAMAANWVHAAGRNSIPSAVIVDKNKTVIWIGHPARIDKVLDRVIAGTYDIATAKADYAKQHAMDAEMEKLQEEFATKLSPLIQSKDYDALDKAFVELEASHSAIKPTIQMVHAQMMLSAKKYDTAYAAADQFSDAATEEDAARLANLARIITMQPGIEKRDLDRAVKYASKAIDLTKGEEPEMLSTLAKIYSEKGDNAKAVEFQQKAVDKSTGEDKAMMEDLLKKYKEPAAK